MNCNVGMNMKLLEIVLVFSFSGIALSKIPPFYNPKHHEMVIKEASDVKVDFDIVSKDIGVGVHVDVENIKESQSINTEQVVLDIYYESLCPDSIDFITKQLYPTRKKLDKYIIPRFNPFGKANFTANEYGGWDFVCQHGSKECKGNLYQACFLTFYDEGGLEKEVDVVNCIMSNDHPDTATLHCMDSFGLSPPKQETVDKCANSVLGQNILHRIGLETKNLKPSLTFIPWIVINGKHTDEMQKGSIDNLEEYLCKNYLSNAPEC